MKSLGFAAREIFFLSSSCGNCSSWTSTTITWIDRKHERAGIHGRRDSVLGLRVRTQDLSIVEELELQDEH